MAGFVFNVTEEPEFVGRAYAVSSSVRGAAAIFQVSLQTNALIIGNNSIFIGGLSGMASPSDVNYTVYETGHSGSLLLDTSIVTNSLQLGPAAANIDGTYEGKRVLLQLDTPDAPLWILDIVLYRGVTRRATVAFDIPAVAGADAADVHVRANYTILYSEQNFLSTAWENAGGMLTLKTTLEAQFDQAPAELRLVFELINPRQDPPQAMAPFVSIDGPVAIRQTPPPPPPACQRPPRLP
jgi:hypothetical protein